MDNLLNQPGLSVGDTVKIILPVKRGKPTIMPGVITSRNNDGTVVIRTDNGRLHIAESVVMYVLIETLPEPAPTPESETPNA